MYVAHYLSLWLPRVLREHGKTITKAGKSVARNCPSGATDQRYQGCGGESKKANTTTKYHQYSYPHWIKVSSSSMTSITGVLRSIPLPTPQPRRGQRKANTSCGVPGPIPKSRLRIALLKLNSQCLFLSWTLRIRQHNGYEVSTF